MPTSRPQVLARLTAQHDEITRLRATLDRAQAVRSAVSLAASAQITLDRLAAQAPAALVLLTLAAYLAPEPSL